MRLRSVLDAVLLTEQALSTVGLNGELADISFPKWLTTVTTVSNALVCSGHRKMRKNNENLAMILTNRCREFACLYWVKVTMTAANARDGCRAFSEMSPQREQNLSQFFRRINVIYTTINAQTFVRPPPVLFETFDFNPSTMELDTFTAAASPGNIFLSPDVGFEFWSRRSKTDSGSGPGHQHLHYRRARPDSDHILGLKAPPNTPHECLSGQLLSEHNTTTGRTAKDSHLRRKQNATFVCPVPKCGEAFTRSFNLRGQPVLSVSRTNLLTGSLSLCGPLAIT
jgi:hypothetical protein